LTAELRWILLGLSVPLLALIWWWTARRSGQSPGNPELRESLGGTPLGGIPSGGTPPAGAPQIGILADMIPPLDPRYADSDDDEDITALSEPRDWGVPPFEPLHIRTGDFDRVPVLDGPMMIHRDAPPRHGSAPEVSMTASVRDVPVLQPAPQAAASQRPAPANVPPASASPARASPARASPARAAPASAVPASAVPASAAPPNALGDNSDRFSPVTPPAPNAAELQRIVTIRVCSVGETRWSGARLLTALEVHGLAFGRYQVFHRKHADGRSLFCVASLIEPGTFDVAAMPDQEFRGVTLFAVLPGPIPPLETMDELLGTARGLAEELSGMVQDAKGNPLSPQRAAAMREDAARFQASLAGH
jgi:cell division protein ZipA